MKLYSQYIILCLSKVFLLLVAVLATVVILIQFLSIINYYQDLGVSFYNILMFVLLSFPSVFVSVSPVAVGCAILYVFYTLRVDNEIVILESSGLSRFNLALPGMVFAIAVTVLCYSVVMVLEPLAKRELYIHKDQMINKIFSSALEERSFNKISSNMMLYLNKRDQNNDLEGIILFDNRIAGKEVTICAERARVAYSNDLITIILQNGSRQEVSEKTLHVLKFNTLSFPVTPTRRASGKGEVLSTYHYMSQQFIPNLIKNFDKSSYARDELHHRLSYPLCNLVISCISLAAVLYGEHGRRWKMRKIWNALMFISLAMVLILVLKNKAGSYTVCAGLLYLSTFAFIYCSLYRLKLDSENRS